MGYILKRVLFFVFAAIVLLSQNLSLGYCAHSHSLFIGACPCEPCDCCPCSEPEEGCLPFLTMQLDDFIEGNLPSIPAAGAPVEIEESSSPAASQRPEQFPALFQRIKPPDGVSLLLRYSIALI